MLIIYSASCLFPLSENQKWDFGILGHTDEDDRMKCTVTDNLGRE